MSITECNVTEDVADKAEDEEDDRREEEVLLCCATSKEIQRSLRTVVQPESVLETQHAALDQLKSITTEDKCRLHSVMLKMIMAISLL